MNKYELCLVLNAKLNDEERTEALDKVKAYITRFGGAASEEIEEWGKRKLAYEINHMKEAYYYFIPFEGESTTPSQLEEHIRIMEPVLRFLVVKPEEVPAAEDEKVEN